MISIFYSREFHNDFCFHSEEKYKPLLWKLTSNYHVKWLLKGFVSELYQHFRVSRRVVKTCHIILSRICLMTWLMSPGSPRGWCPAPAWWPGMVHTVLITRVTHCHTRDDFIEMWSKFNWQRQLSKSLCWDNFYEAFTLTIQIIFCTALHDVLIYPRYDTAPYSDLGVLVML